MNAQPTTHPTAEQLTAYALGKLNGIDVLRRMKSLRTIAVAQNPGTKDYPAEEFWKKYDAGEFKK